MHNNVLIHVICNHFTGVGEGHTRIVLAVAQDDNHFVSAVENVLLCLCVYVCVT